MTQLLNMSIAGGILIAAAVILRAVAGQRLPRWTFLALWGVALARLLIPFSLPSPTSVYRAAGTLSGTAGRAGLTTAGNAAPAELAGTAPAAAPSPWVLLWAAGALTLALFLLLTHLRGRRDYRASLPVDDPFVAAWLADHPLRRPVQVRCSDRIDTPLTYGAFRPVILLPKGLDRTDRERLSFVLAHEMAHVRRWDALGKLLLVAALCVHWFNPLVWVMFLLAGRDLEVSCDQSVVRLYGPQARGPYARTLLELEARRTRLLPLASGFSRTALEERIGAIMKSRKATALGLIAAAALVVVITALFATSAPADPEDSSASGSSGLVSTAVLDRVLGPGVTVAQSQNGTAYITSTSETDWLKPDPDTGHYYTRDQYDQVAALKQEGYEALSIAQFNRTLYAKLSGEDEALFLAYEQVLSDIPAEDPLAAFLVNTAQPSLAEYSARVDEVFSGKRTDPAFRGQLSRTETADVYGDQVEVGWVQASYRFTYRILDQDALTVGERDAFLQAILDGMQAWLDAQPAAGLNDREAMEQALLDELDRLGKAASSGRIEYTGGQLDEYYAEAVYEGVSGFLAQEASA